MPRPRPQLVRDDATPERRSGAPAHTLQWPGFDADAVFSIAAADEWDRLALVHVPGWLLENVSGVPAIVERFARELAGAEAAARKAVVAKGMKAADADPELQRLTTAERREALTDRWKAQGAALARHKARERGL